MDCRARSTASRPESVHSARIPTRVSSFATLSQVLKSSSTTSALRPASSAIFSSRRLPVCTRSGQADDKLGALVLLGLHLDRAAHHLDNIPGDGHAEAGSRIRLTVEVRSRSNGSKIFCANPTHADAVVADTELVLCTVAHGSGKLPDTHETVPPAGVNLMALDSRLSRICPIRVRSQ